MRRALELARQGRFTVSPNPQVGCVITRQKSNETPSIVAEGYHARKGQAHAERAALASCLEDPRGATLYVNLEPCCHTGATSPCTEAILQAGIARVVAATLDPFEPVQGRGVATLRQHGIQVDVGLLADEARYLNRFFMHRHETGLPWVILKCAMSLDGKLATASGGSQWITGESARRHVHETRAECDAILAGIGTVLRDDPSLTARPEGLSVDEFNPPRRVILDSNLRLSPTAKVFVAETQSPLWVFCAEGTHKERSEISRKTQTAGARIFSIAQTNDGLNLHDVLRALAQHDCLSVMLEGGPKIHTAFLQRRLVNEVMAYIAPILIGGKQAPGFFEGQGITQLTEAPRLQRLQRKLLEEDTLIQGVLRWRLNNPYPPNVNPA